jgi:hypothetical protein
MRATAFGSIGIGIPKTFEVRRMISANSFRGIKVDFGADAKARP